MAFLWHFDGTVWYISFDKHKALDSLFSPKLSGIQIYGWSMKSSLVRYSAKYQAFGGSVGISEIRPDDLRDSTRFSGYFQPLTHDL